jgi:hypothetical protein
VVPARNTSTKRRLVGTTWQGSGGTAVPQRGDSQGARHVAWRQRGHAPMTLDPGQRMRCPGEVHPAAYDRCLFIWRGALG